MEIDIKVTGLKEALEGLDTLASPKLQRAILQNSLTEAMKPAKADAKARLGKGAGYIVTKKLRASGASTVARAGIGIAGKHWPLIFREYGTVERTTKKGYRREKITAKPFIRPACDSKFSESISKVQDYVAAETDRIIEGKQKAISPLKDMDEVT